jgi:dienelactone hydrolase
MKLFTAVAFAAVLAAAGATHAAPALEAYGKLPAIQPSQFKLSPSGTRIAFVTATKQPGVRQLVVRELSGKTLTAANLTGKLWGVRWAGDDFVLISTSTTLNNPWWEVGEYPQIAVLNLKTGKSFVVFQGVPKIFPTVFRNYGVGQVGGRWYGFYAGVTLDGGGGGLVDFDRKQYAITHTWFDLYKVDLESGATSRLAAGGRNVDGWAVTDDGSVVAHSEYTKESGAWKLFANVPDAPKLMEIASPLAKVSLDGPSYRPGFVLVSDAANGGEGLQEVELSTGHAMPLVPKAESMIQDYVTGTGSEAPAGVVLEGDRPTTRFFDPAVQALFEKASRPFKNLSVTYISADRSWKRWILFTEGEGDSGTYYLVDLTTGSAEIVATAYPDVDTDVAPSRVITYKAADGLELEAILTTPGGKPAKNLPLVVMPHGGPAARDHLGFDWFAQAFASRGYAVLQPNFRGSDGFSPAFLEAGAGQWGRKMQTDVSDGLAELVKQGIVDPKRVCIVGWSYGGYAALAGVTLQQGLYRCAVSYGGLADMNLIMRDASDGSNPYTRHMRNQLGARNSGDPVIKAVSPAFHADRADAPVLLMHGRDDSVVEIAQSRAMADALKAAHKPVELIELDDADHWLTREDKRQQMLKAAVEFVEKHNPPG